MSRFYIGDKVYPADGYAIYCNVQDIIFDNDGTVEEGYFTNPIYIYGIVTGINDEDGDEPSYSITWIDGRTRKEASTGYNCSWWEFDELTTDQEAYLSLYNEKLEEAKQEYENWKETEAEN